MVWLTLFTLSIFSLYSQSSQTILRRDLKGNITQNFASQGIEFSIASDKSRYAEKEDIPIFLKITNIGHYPVTLYVHKNYLQNFTIVVRDEKGRNLSIKEVIYKSKMGSSKDPFYKNYTGTLHNYRVLILQPNEIFVKRIILQDIVEIVKKKEDTEKFQIQGYFYPNPGQADTIFLKSINHYIVFIDSDKSVDGVQRTAIYSEDRLAITPKEIVYLTLSAEYANDWSNFFKYLSLPDLIKDYPEYARRYIRSSQNQRAIVLNDFRLYLQSDDVHQLIRFNVIPNKINKYLRKISKQTATVQSEVIRLIDGFHRKFLYTYYLTKTESLWKITGVESQLLK